MDIKRIVSKVRGKNEEITYVALVNGKELRNYFIFRELFGITSESGWGILNEEGDGIEISIGGDIKIFNWNRIDENNPQIEIQRRVNEVRQWIAILSYTKEIQFTVEI